MAVRLIYLFAIPLCAEDAYITFHAWWDPTWRHATTSPAWMVATMGQPDLARALNLVGDLGAVLSASRVLTSPGMWAFVGFWCLPFFSGSSVSGLESHLAACALIVSVAHPRFLALAAGLRPDTAVMALIASGSRWRWAVGGLVVGVAGLLWCGSQTMGAKLSAYGVHPFAGWYWWRPEAFGWLALPLVGLALWKRDKATTGALAILAVLWALGVPEFWWYAVPPFAVLGFMACKRITGWWLLPLGLSLVAVSWQHQHERLAERVRQEARVWDYATDLRQHRLEGVALLEPAGIIPWLNPHLSVVDEIGLVSGGKRSGPGWYADLIRTHRPRLIVLRTKQYVELNYGFDAQPFTGEHAPFRSRAEAVELLSGYRPLFRPPVTRTEKTVAYPASSSSLVFLVK